MTRVTSRKNLQIPMPGTGKGELKTVCGSQSDDFNQLVANQAFQSLWILHPDPRAWEQQLRGTAAALAGIRPTDESEGMLAAQMVAAHNAAMECYRRAMLKEQTVEGRHDNLRQAAKLSRVYAELMLALDKRRGKGEQRVTVEHVHVHRGGQAIVGAVQAGGGTSSKSEELPHAPALAYEPGQTLQGEIQAVGQAVPLTRR